MVPLIQGGKVSSKEIGKTKINILGCLTANGNIHAVDRCFINRQALIWIVDIKSVYKLSLRSDHCIQTLSLSVYVCIYTHTHTYMFIHHLSPVIHTTVSTL